MWVHYSSDLRSDRFFIFLHGQNALRFARPNESCMMIPGTYAEMHEDYS